MRRRRILQQMYSFSPKQLGSALVMWLRADLGLVVAMSAITATGTTPPTVTLTGTLATGQTQTISTTHYVEVDVNDISGGATRGLAKFQWKLNGTVQQTGQTTAATFVLGSTGLTVNFAAGTYAADNVYVADINLTSIADQSGAGNGCTGTGTVIPFSNGINGRQCLRTVSGSAGFLSSVHNANVILTGATSAERIMVYKTLADPPVGGATSSNGGWSSSGNTENIPFTDGNDYDPFASTVRKTFAKQSTYTTPLIYDSYSAANDWQAFVNGTSVFSTATNTYGVGTGLTLFNNVDVAVGEYMVFNRKLTTDERQNLKRYLSGFWNIAVS